MYSGDLGVSCPRVKNQFWDFFVFELYLSNQALVSNDSGLIIKQESCVAIVKNVWCISPVYEDL